jgi:hypothetical protein
MAPGKTSQPTSRFFSRSVSDYECGKYNEFHKHKGTLNNLQY